MPSGMLGRWCESSGLTDRQRWQEELAELPALIGRWENELAGLPPGERTRREMYDWMIRRDRLRLETLAKWLAQADNEPA